MFAKFTQDELKEIEAEQKLEVDETSEPIQRQVRPNVVAEFTSGAITCDVCGKKFLPGNIGELPSGIGIEHEDGTVTNICIECLLRYGMC